MLDRSALSKGLVTMIMAGCGACASLSTSCETLRRQLRAHTDASICAGYAGPMSPMALSRSRFMERRVDCRGPLPMRWAWSADQGLEEEIAELRSSEKIDAELAG